VLGRLLIPTVFANL